MLKFPRTMKACLESEGSLWAIGDALIKEAEDRHSGPRGLAAVAHELEQSGIEKSANTLSHYRAGAAAFPKSRRHDLPFAVHLDAGNPDTLDAIVKAAKRSGATITKWYVRDALREMQEEERRERQREAAEAKREADKAQAELEAARKQEMRSTDSRDRERAAEQRRKAAERAKAAKEEAKRARTAPKRSERKAPDEQEIPFSVFRTQFMAEIGEAKKIAAKLTTDVKPFLDSLTPVFVNAAVERALETAEAFRKLADVLRSQQTNKRAHLSAVN